MLVLALAQIATPAHAGAWLQNEGRGQIIFSGNLSFARQRFAHNGKSLVLPGRFSKQALTANVEYGLNTNLTLLAVTGLQHQSIPATNTPSHPVSGVLGLGAKTRLWQNDRSVVSLQGSFHLGEERNLAGRLRRNDAPAEADLRVNFGHSFAVGGLPAFIDAQAGYRWRGGRNIDEIRFDLTFGIRPRPDFLVLLQSFNAQGVTGNKRFDEGSHRSHKMQISAVYDLSPIWAVQAGAFTSIHGANSLREKGAIVALWRKL